MGWVNAHSPRLNAAANLACRALRLYWANGSARAWGVLFSHLRRRVCDPLVPRLITVAPTYRCPCRCVHCYASAPDRREEDELSTEQLKALIDQAKRLGVIEVIFSGGEPLLRDDLAGLVRHAHAAGLLTRVNTSGALLDPDRVAELKDAGLTQCGVSIDDADPATHDRLRGLPGAHARAIEGIRHLRAANVLCQVLVYAAKRNVTAGLERIVELARRLGVFAVYIFFPVAVGRWDGAGEEVLSAEERARARALQDLTFVHLELPTSQTRCCVYTRNILYVSPRGDVTPCPFVPYVIGNVAEHSLEDLWRGYSATLGGECRGECPLNLPLPRAALKAHVESVAANLEVVHSR